MDETHNFTGEKTVIAHLLIIDDAPTQRLILKALVKKMACTAEIVSLGSNPFEALEKQAFDVIILDLQALETEGIALTQQVRLWTTSSPNGTRNLTTIPIIALASHPLNHTDWQRCLEAGMTICIYKPINFHELQDTIHSSLKPTHQHSFDCIAAIPVFDMKALCDFIDDDPAACQEMIELFISDTQNKINRIQEMIDKQIDRDTLRRTSHSIKGSSGMIQAQRLKNAAAALEAQCEYENWLSIEEHFNTLVTEFEVFKQTAQTHFADLT
ncbi:MAG: response regulator [Chitinivibrionales bacterium]|nr:response regulator [Chitinivibrionales bacterium]